MKRIIFPISILLIMVSSCGKKTETNLKPVRPVRAVQASRNLHGDAKIFTALAQPAQDVTLSLRVGGPLITFSAETGRYFRKGKTIAHIDPRDFKIRLSQAQGTFQQAEAEFLRYKTLRDQNNISQSAFEKVEAQYISAKSNLENAQNALHDTHLIAPFNGYIQQVFVENHEDVRPLQPIVTFLNMDALELQADVSEEIARNITSIQNMEVYFEAYPNTPIPLTLKELGKNTSSSHLTYPLVARLKDIPSNITVIGGMAGNLHIHLKKESYFPRVPLEALLNNAQGQTFIWKINPPSKSVEKVEVQLGKLTPPNQVEIISGISEGDWIVTAGIRSLEEGQKVAPIKTPIIPIPNSPTALR